MLLADFSSFASNEELIPTAEILIGAVLGALLAAFMVKTFLERSSLKDRPWRKKVEPALTKLAFWGVLLSGFSSALNQLEYFQTRAGASVFIDRALTLVWLCYFVSTVSGIARAFYAIEISRDHSRDPGYMNRVLVIRKIVVGAIVGMCCVYGLRTVGFDTSPLLAGGALGGVILGLAFQQSLSNVFSGLLFTWDGGVRIGDLIQFPDGREGFLEKIGWRSCIVRLSDGAKLLIPNSKISESTLINLGRTRKAHIHATVVVPAEVDPESAERNVEEVVHRLQLVHASENEKQKPSILWDTSDGSAMRLKVSMTISDAEAQVAAQSQLNKELHRIVNTELPAEAEKRNSA